ncbi:hypothetical protein MKX01_001762, partial [Papaver californicum]
MLKRHSSFRGLFLPLRYHQGLKKNKPKFLYCSNMPTLLSPLWSLNFVEADPFCNVTSINKNNDSSMVSSIKSHQMFQKKPRLLINSLPLNSTSSIEQVVPVTKLYDKETLKMYSGLLQDCSMKGSLCDGKAVHGQGCASLGNAREGQIVHSLAIKIGTELDGILSSSLVDMYSKCGLAEDAQKIFVRVLNPDVVAWSTMIACLDQQGKTYELTKLFAGMGKARLRPNQYTLASVVSASTNLSDLRYGKSVHACICKSGLDSDKSVSNALITMYMKSGSVQDGFRVFEAMEDRDSISWNAFLSGFHEGDACSQAPIIFNRMVME